ncbi:MAG: hypothetical protein NTW12_12750 [Deltaproteobacteria bacterium]|nr:hypothetical protein [Deltaproteobacteria bacterium]
MFRDALKLTLYLTIKNEVFNIPGGDITDFRVSLYPYGFEAQAEFRVYSDTEEDSMFLCFTKPDLIEARLSMQGVHNLPEPAPEPLIVKGLVTGKSFRETTFSGVTGNPVYIRYYKIEFQDAARVLWTQHFPTVLYADASMEDVIKAQIPEGISLEMNWPPLNEKQPMIFLGLGNDQVRSSFYDFLIWYVRSFNGVFTYDNQHQTYHLGNNKKVDGDEQYVRLNDLAGFSLHMPEPCRHNVRVLNAYSENPLKIPLPNTLATNDLRRDLLVRREVQASLVQDANRERPRLESRKHELLLELRQFPLIPFYPGVFIGFMEAEMSKEIYAYGKDYRICTIRLTGASEKKGRDDDRGTLFTTYACDMTASLELKEETGVSLPAFTLPRYPLSVEGKIVSEMGEDKDKTYQFYAGNTTQESYRVFVPLWNKTIPVPYEPRQLTGHFYFPAYKNTRVLVDLYFDRAEINRYLDWGSDVRLPMDTQGDHLLMGKNEKTNISINHIYVDGKPVFSTKRIHGKDTGIVTMEEGKIVFEVKEDESLPGTEEVFDVTPKVAAAMTKCSMEVLGAKDGIKSDYESTSSATVAEMDAAVSRTKGALEAMDAAITGKTSAITGRIEAVMSQLSQKSGALTSKVTALAKELRDKIGL